MEVANRKIEFNFQSNRLRPFSLRKYLQTIVIVLTFRIPVLAILLTFSSIQVNIVICAENDEDDPIPQQLGGLRTCSIQEENIQGRTIVGTILADICQGTDHSETILGLQDNDILSGSGGDDIVNGNDGDDKILGYAGDDVLQGDSGDDKIDGGGRNDVLIGGDGDDILTGLLAMI